jgi:two-component system, OmpR family, response regulator
MEPSQHILVVDDDLDIRQLLGDYLRKNGYRATTVPDGAMMRKTLAREAVDLLVLDIMLRGEDGLALCRTVRTQSNTPLIMLTARGDPLDRIIGLEMGADDYLSKPFLPRELLARIKTVLRRVDPRAPHRTPLEVQSYRFAAWTLDTITRNLTDDRGIVVPLSGSEYRVLAKLLSARKRVLTRTQLADANGQRGVDPFDRSIDVCISRLRQILGEDAREPTIIKTVYGEGYVIGVDVTTS